MVLTAVNVIWILYVVSVMLFDLKYDLKSHSDVLVVSVGVLAFLWGFYFFIKYVLINTIKYILRGFVDKPDKNDGKI